LKAAIALLDFLFDQTMEDGTKNIFSSAAATIDMLQWGFLVA